MRPLRTAIIDDDPDHNGLLRDLLGRLALPIELVGTALNVTDGLALVRAQGPDLVLLDIEMPGHSGLDLLAGLPQRSFEAVLITSHGEHALRALKLHTFDYLMKPVDPLELASVIERVHGRIAARHAPASPAASRLAVAMRDGVRFISIPDIVRCEADNVYTTLVIKGRSIVSSKPIADFERRLRDHGFIRVHRSHLVNTSHIAKYQRGDPGTLTLADGSNVPVSSGYKEAFHKAIGLT